MSAKSIPKPAQFKVRLKIPLKAKIEKAARRRQVSINAEIIHRLELSFLTSGGGREE